MARSLLSQLEQIAGSLNYDDLMVDIHLGASAEPPDSTISGSLEYDINLLRSHVREVKDLTEDWYAGLPTYAAAYDGSTISGSLKALASPTHGTGNVLDAKSIILPVEYPSGGASVAISTTDSGTLMVVSTQYAVDADRRGLPIYYSATGDYYDEGGEDRVVRVDLLDASNDQEFAGSNGEVVFGRLWDGLDTPTGSGTGTDVFVHFYTVSGTYTWDAGDPSDIKIIYPQRKVLSEMEEWDWLRTDFVSSWEGDVELVEDIYNLWQFTGAGDGVTSPTWTNTTSCYALQNNPGDLEGGINDINDAIGDRTYTEENYVTSCESITSSIDELDKAIVTISGAVTGHEKYVWTNTGAAITAETPIDLPYSLTYTPHASDTQPGRYMDIYVDGQLIVADYSTLGNNDYSEDDSDTWTPHFTIRAGSNITYIIDN